MSDTGEGASVEAAVCDVQASGLGDWGHVVHFLISQEPLLRGGTMCCIGEGNGSPLQYSCLESPRDGGAWWVPANAGDMGSIPGPGNSLMLQSWIVSVS